MSPRTHMTCFGRDGWAATPAHGSVSGSGVQVLEARRTVIAAVLAAAALAPMPAGASHCDSKVAIFSRTAGAVAAGPALNAHAFVCIGTVALGVDSVDARIINPGANEVQIRWAPTPMPDLPQVTAALSGQLATQASVTLVRVQVLGGGAFESPWLALGGGPGSLTATIQVLTYPAATYRTIDSGA